MCQPGRATIHQQQRGGAGKACGQMVTAGVFQDQRGRRWAGPIPAAGLPHLGSRGSLPPPLRKALLPLQETRIRATERDPKSRLQSMLVTNRYGGEEVTHTLLAENRAETQRWMEAFWQHFYDMSKWERGHGGGCTWAVSCGGCWFSC